jgi:bisphosphoglycerate-independent phosphoglycerate mutase (AlkP superfamily)
MVLVTAMTKNIMQFFLRIHQIGITYSKTYPNSLINASESFVGLPEGQMGNSEVGHLCIGAGRVIDQDLDRINKSIKDESFFSNDILNSWIRKNCTK